ncbi:MAG: hypothetical protein HYY13_00260 [Nitrospirae bacterium]|nr:hypothetical protein [Nitrospirota bacterium]
MSGVAGILRLDGGRADAGAVREMLATIAHRGADGSAVLTDGAMAMGHRLMRVDERSPMPFAGGGLHLVADGRFDGVIGPEAVTESPVERVISEYRRCGLDFPEQLRGDFAIALWDRAAGRLILARDAMGMKPLFYWIGSRCLAFASECKAILALPDAPRRPCRKRLAEYTRFRFRGLEETFFEGVRRVVPGEILWHEGGSLHRRRFWGPWSGTPTRHPREAHLSEFRDRLLEAVRVRLPSSGPAVIALSGGLDSSSIACGAAHLVRQGASGASLHALSVLPGPYANEMEYVREVCERWDLPNTVVDFGPLRVGHRLGDMVRRLESPFVEKEDEAFGERLFGTVHALGSRVLLMGYAGDEAMTGWAYLADLLREGRWIRFWRETRAFRRGGGPPLEDLIRRVARFLLLPNRLLPGEPSARYHTCNQMEMHVALFNLYQVMTLESWDMNAAAQGVEIRLPFRDQRLIDLLFSLPASVRIHQGMDKPLLRDALKGVLPERVAQRVGKCDYTSFWSEKLEEAGFTGRTFSERTEQWRRHTRAEWEANWFGLTGEKHAEQHPR